jgi:hypothetical protein
LRVPDATRQNPQQIENVSLVVRDIEPLQQLHVFFSETRASVMLLLILNIPDHRAELRMGIGKSAEPFLPRKSTGIPMLVVNKSGRSGLYVAKLDPTARGSAFGQSACERDPAGC